MVSKVLFMYIPYPKDEQMKLKLESSMVDDVVISETCNFSRRIIQLSNQFYK